MSYAARRAARAVLLVLIATSPGTSAAGRHAHEGVLAPYSRAPPDIELSATDRSRLARGETLIREFRFHGEDRALAVVRVHASPSLVWSVLLDFEAYPSWVDGLESSEVYERDGADIYVTFTYRRWPVGAIVYHVHHRYPGAAAGWGTWTLDHRRRSDLDDTVGFWRVLPVDGDPDSAHVVYSTRVRLNDGLAQWLGDWLLEDTLRAVTDGLKVKAEQAQASSRP